MIDLEKKGKIATGLKQKSKKWTYKYNKEDPDEKFKIVEKNATISTRLIDLFHLQ